MAGENVVTVDVSELPLQRLTQIKQELDGQIDLFGASLQQLKLAQKKYQDSRECVEKMQEEKAGKSLLVPLTDSMYVPGQLDDTSRVIIDIGTGYFVEKDIPDSIDYFKRKVKFVTTQLEKVQQIMKEKLVAREVVIETMEGKIQATLAAQQSSSAVKT